MTAQTPPPAVVVAIDGPAGAGKSTVAAALADRLGVDHVDTGAYYRAATLAVLRAGTDVRDGVRCGLIASRAAIRRRGGRTYLDEEDVEAEIRGPAVTASVSAVSAHPQVRRALLDRQRERARTGGAVVEGRDAGTAVVPDAPLKVWLTATPAVRARRRAAQLGDTSPAAVAAHEADIERRDASDAAQMARAPDALVVDTSERDIDDIVAELAAEAARRAALREDGLR